MKDETLKAIPVDKPVSVPVRFGLGHLMDADDNVLCVMRSHSKPGSPLVQDVAAIICRAVNNHEALQTRVSELEAALRHYADESLWDDPHPDLGTQGTLYNFEDEIDGAIPGYQVARQVLATTGEKENDD